MKTLVSTGHLCHSAQLLFSDTIIKRKVLKQEVPGERLFAPLSAFPGSFSSAATELHSMLLFSTMVCSHARKRCCLNDGKDLSMKLAALMVPSKAGAR